MFNKLEIAAAGLGIVIIVVAFILLQDRAQLTLATNTQSASVLEGTIASDNNNEMSVKNNLIVNDIKEGTGKPVETGNIVTVHYVGTFEDGQEFDASKRRGEPLTFKVGAGNVIRGWEEGLLGMKVGGERALIIPPELAYGERGIGPIPPNTTLKFNIELLAIDNE